MALLATIREVCRSLFMGLLGAAFVCITLAAMPSVSQVADEYHVKAAFLFNFTRFVEWPSTTFRSPHDPFVVCVLGADPFGSALEETLVGKQIDGRTFRILRISDATHANSCQILFISLFERKRIAAIITALPLYGVLTVSEMDDFIISDLITLRVYSTIGIKKSVDNLF